MGNIDIKTSIIWIAVVSSVCIGATYTLTNQLFDNRVEVLNEKLKSKNDTIKQMQEANKQQEKPTIFVSDTIKEKIDLKLKEEIQKSEQKQRELLKQIVSLESDVFEPNSELSEL